MLAAALLFSGVGFSAFSQVDTTATSAPMPETQLDSLMSQRD